jgi:NADH:ubiquinone oxidoreductase subunit 4 (subunit M)
MELLLNLVWIALASGAFLIFLRRQHRSRRKRISGARSLLALSFVLLLLFPIVSASDDLHPTQAVLEEATKRVQQLIVPLHSSSDGFVVPVLSILPATLFLLTLAAWPSLEITERRACPREGHLFSLHGRAPPFFHS